MWKKLSAFIARLLDKQIDATGLALFRILFFTALFFEVLQLFCFRHLIYDSLPFVTGNEVTVNLGLLLWLVVIFFMIIGLFTRVSSVINYLLTVVFMGGAGEFVYHMFYLYTAINLLVIFLPISKVLSIDRLLVKLKYSSARFKYEPSTKVSALAYLIPAMLGIGFVYYDSILYKFVSSYWLHGMGMWLPSSLPMITHVDNSWLLNNQWLMKFVGYLTLVFEFVFLFFFWNKKLRVPLLIIGIGLHLGILMEFPIPYFAIGVTALYLLMVPVSWWRKVQFNRANKKTLRFYYDAECPLCVRAVIALMHFDIFKRVDFRTVQSSSSSEAALKSLSYDELLNDIHSVVDGKVYKGYDTYCKATAAMIWTWPLSVIMRLPGVSHFGRMVYRHIAENRTNERCTDETCGYEPPVLPKTDGDMKLLHNFTLRDLKVEGIKYGMLVVVLLQLAVSLNSSLIKKTRHSSVLKNTFIDQPVTKFSAAIRSVSRPVFGITNHPVFMDFHFRNYNHIVAVAYEKDGKVKFLPMINEKGQPGKYLFGPIFVNWTFRVNYADVDMAKLSSGILRYTAFWAGTKSMPLKDLHFRILVKKIDNYSDWESDFLKKQLAKPWQLAGKATWENGQFHIEMSDIEKL